MQLQSTSHESQARMHESYSMYKIQKMLKILQSKGHTCFLEIEYNRYANTYETAEELEADYRLRINDGFEERRYRDDNINTIMCALTNFINKKGYDYGGRK